MNADQQQIIDEKIKTLENVFNNYNKEILKCQEQIDQCIKIQNILKDRIKKLKEN